jgi:hypothetical protein
MNEITAVARRRDREAAHASIFTRKDAPDAIEGMTRRTYYLAAADAESLDDAVARIHAALQELVPKHRILGALIADRVATSEDAVLKRLKAEVIADLI